MPGTEMTFQGRGVRLAAERWDAAPPNRGTLLLLHGGGQTRHSWDKSATRFAAAGWTTYTIDARGHGDSEWAPDEDYSMDSLVADLRAVVAQLDAAVVLVGASMGGMTAMVAEGEHGGIASALVLVDIAPRMEPVGVARIRGFMTSHLGGFDTLEDVAEAIHEYTPNRKRATNLEGLKKNVRLHEDGRWYWHWDPAFMRLGDEPDRHVAHRRLEEAARGVRVPTLLVRGAQSDVVTPESAEELRELIPGAWVEEAPAGHMVAGDDNDVFAQQVLGFLDESL
ncbi:MAG: alpha/beta fold hydrolase [Solirubrobacteraceae bacterium]